MTLRKTEFSKLEGLTQTLMYTSAQHTTILL
ncbi:hypothetical protein GGP62_003425, partial [Salinibacter ruber]